MNNTQKTVALLQDISGLLTEIQPLLTDGKVHDLRVVAAVRLIRKEAGDLLDDLTNEQKIVDGYRESAVDAIAGVTLLLARPFDGATDVEIHQAMVGMTLAAGRIKEYFGAKQAVAQEAQTCAAG